MDFRADRWVEIVDPAAFSGRNNHGVCTGNGYIYLTGGYASGIATSDVYRSADGVTFELLTSSPGWAARGAHGCLFYNGRIYIFAGSNEGGTFFNDCWSSPTGLPGTWVQETAAAAFAARHELSFCVHNGEMYLSGGYNTSGDTYYADVWKSTNGSLWSLVTSNFGQAMRQHCMMSFLTNLYIYGGNYASSTNFNTIWRSVDNGVNWTQPANIWAPRKDLKGLINDTADQLILLGGRTQTAAYDDAYVTSDGLAFTEITQLTTRETRYSTGYVYFNKNIHQIAGRAGSTDHDDVWKEQYQIVYNANGGISPPADTNFYDPEDTPLVLGPGGMTRDWYTFNSWNTESNGSGTTYNPSDPLIFVDSGVTTLYAQWDEAPVPDVYYVEAVGGNVPPFDTRPNASPTLFNLYDTMPAFAWHPGVIVYCFGEINEPHEWEWMEMQGVQIVGEDPQTTVIDMNSNVMEGQSLYRCTFKTETSNAEWNTCIYDPEEVINCKFEGNDLWYSAIDVGTAKANTRLLGNSYRNFKEDAVYIRDNPAGGWGELIIANNSAENGNIWIDIYSSTANKFHFYNNMVDNAVAPIYIELTTMTILEFLHDHNISTGGYDYSEDSVPFLPDATETVDDPGFLGIDPDNMLNIDEVSPGANAGITRLTMPSVDLFDVTYGSPPSMGAYEIESGPTCPNLPPINPNKWMDIALAGMAFDTTTLGLVISGMFSTFGYHTFTGSVSNIITDHVARGLSLLITEFRRKRPENSLPNPNNIINLLTPFLQQVQLVEYMESDLDTLRWLDTAYGVQLDGLGDILQVSRDGRTDDEYRVALKFQVYINKSSGEPEVIIAFVKDFTNATKVRLQEAYPAGLFIFTDGTSVLTEINLSAAIEQIMAAGVKLRGIFYLDPDAVYFSFDWDGFPIDPQYKGFDELNYLESGEHVGGQLFELIK